MERKKGSVGSITLIVAIIIIFIIAMAVVLILVVEKPNGNNLPQQKNYSMKLYAKAVNIKNEKQIEVNYRLESNGTLISSGILGKDALAEISVPNKPIDLICWSDNYYLGGIRKTFTQPELSSNISTIECKLHEIGKIIVEHTGEIKNGESIIKLNISTDKNLENIKICNSWTAGIISALPRQKNLICDNGNWLNSSYKEFPNLFYRCGDCIGDYCDWIEKCEAVNGRFCNPFLHNTPKRYERKVDDCYNTGITLNENSVVVEYLVKAKDPTPLDEIMFYVLFSYRDIKTFEIFIK